MDKKSGEGFGNLCCSFCGKNQREVKKLIAGPGTYICDECVDLCNEILDEELFDSNTSSSEESKEQELPLITDIPKPKEIKEYLG